MCAGDESLRAYARKTLKRLTNFPALHIVHSKYFTHLIDIYQTVTTAVNSDIFETTKTMQINTKTLLKNNKTVHRSVEI